jgi:PleD family two-component response regulator
VAISLAAFAAHAACVFLKADMPPEVAALACAMIAASAYVTLAANRLLERDERRNFLSTLRDRLVHERTRVEATTDALTGLANRHLLRERLEDVWAGKEDRARTAAIVMLDLDHFKTFNDRYGHPAGDECLRQVTACALAHLRDARDLAARYGGEELLLVLPSPSESVAASRRSPSRTRRSTPRAW